MPHRAAPRKSTFGRFARWSSHKTGRPATFIAAVTIVMAWAVTGPIFRFSDTWQLVINTGTTIITFLMVFLIQHTQNTDAEAVQIKLDEIIRSLEGAHNRMLDLEELDADDLERIRVRYKRLAESARRDAESGRPDTDAPEIAEGAKPAHRRNKRARR